MRSLKRKVNMLVSGFLLGEPLPLIGVPTASSRCCGAIYLVYLSFFPLQSPYHRHRRASLRRGRCQRRHASPLLLRSRCLLQRVRGEILMLPRLFVSPLPALCRRRSAAVPPHSPWPASTLFRVVIKLRSVSNRCAMLLWVFWYLGRRRWSHCRRGITGQRACRRSQRWRLKMTSGVGLSVTQRSNWFFLFSELNE
jgi:hypothetical protein